MKTAAECLHPSCVVLRAACERAHTVGASHGARVHQRCVARRLGASWAKSACCLVHLCCREVWPRAHLGALPPSFAPWTLQPVSGACDTPRVPSSWVAVYDITNTPNAHANEAIKTLNRFTRDTFGLGGIFHGAVEVNGEEWSFGAPAPVTRRRPGTARCSGCLPPTSPSPAPHRPCTPGLPLTRRVTHARLLPVWDRGACHCERWWSCREAGH